MGYWTRTNGELCLLATRVSPKRLAKDVHQVILSPRGEHSHKPEEVRARIERLLPGPYLEFFARRAADGWTTWGNEMSRGKARSGEAGNVPQPAEADMRAASAQGLVSLGLMGNVGPDRGKALHKAGRAFDG
jgi:MT-A70